MQVTGSNYNLVNKKVNKQNYSQLSFGIRKPSLTNIARKTRNVAKKQGMHVALQGLGFVAMQKIFNGGISTAELLTWQTLAGKMLIDAAEALDVMRKGEGSFVGHFDELTPGKHLTNTFALTRTAVGKIKGRFKKTPKVSDN